VYALVGFKFFRVLIAQKTNNMFLLASLKIITNFKNPLRNPLRGPCGGIQKPALYRKTCSRTRAVILKIVP
jgi:hypothetical protein